VNSGWVVAGALAYMIVGATLFAYGGWYTLMQRYPLSTLSPYALTAPIFGVFASVIALGEPFTLKAAFGAALTLGGVGLLTLVRRSPKA
jgi:O-acetylserine/cysteine efflux transporter